MRRLVTCSALALLACNTPPGPASMVIVPAEPRTTGILVAVLTQEAADGGWVSDTRQYARSGGKGRASADLHGATTGA